MNDFDGAVQRPTGPEDTGGSNPVGMTDPDAGPITSTAERAVGMDVVTPEGVSPLDHDTPSVGWNSPVDAVGEDTGLSEAQVLGREPLPETED